MRLREHSLKRNLEVGLGRLLFVLYVPVDGSVQAFVQLLAVSGRGCVGCGRSADRNLPVSGVVTSADIALDLGWCQLCRVSRLAGGPTARGRIGFRLGPGSFGSQEVSEEKELYSGASR
jgi:hypothetical protein